MDAILKVDWNKVVEDLLRDEPAPPRESDETRYIPRESFTVELFAYETIGMSVGHGGGLGRVDFG